MNSTRNSRKSIQSLEFISESEAKIDKSVSSMRDLCSLSLSVGSLRSANGPSALVLEWLTVPIVNGSSCYSIYVAEQISGGTLA